MGNCLSKVCNKKKDVKKRSVVTPGGGCITCCCGSNINEVQKIYEEISIEAVEI